MALPTLTDEQRKAAMDKALEVRRHRAAVKAKIKAGELAIDDVVGDPDCARMRVSEMLRSLPGIGKAHAASIMALAGVPENRRLQGLGSRQLAALNEALSAARKQSPED